MLQNRTWIDPKAEAEFWGHMQRLEILHARMAAQGRWESLLGGVLSRRNSLQRNIDALHVLAQALVDQHTVLRDDGAFQAAPPLAGSDDAATNAPLRTLAGMVVSLRQDRAIPLEAGEEKSA